MSLPPEKCREIRAAALRRIQSLGHEIGLHFDEKGYGPELSP